MPVTETRRTPGVYITELDAFPPSVVGVQTAVPGFVGYTQRAEIGGKPVYFKPVELRSLADYESIFGTGFKPTYVILPVTADKVQEDPTSYDVVVVDSTDPEAPVPAYFKINQTGDSQFLLYYSLRLFFDNGGDTCYVVSVGDYTNQGATAEGVPIALANLEKGLTAIGDTSGPTILAIPDAVLLDPTTAGQPEDGSADFNTLVVKMLQQCADLQDRVAILDVYGTNALDQTDGATFSVNYKKTIEAFRNGVGSDYLSFGMAYFPFLNTSTVTADIVDYTYFNIDQLTDVLTLQANTLYLGKPEQLDTVTGYIADMATVTGAKAITALNQNLTNALPVLKQLSKQVSLALGVLPPSGGMAGVFTKNDQNRGVWNAPANTSMVSVISPTLKIDNDLQADLNVPLNGKAVDAIRAFPGRGTVVWGARTLDGNSNDWRYVQVRRTLVYIEQSIKAAIDPFVFAANDGKTWVTVVSMISNFLNRLWSQGGLMGSTPNEAYTVECGLGSTMTAQDILEGYMVVQVTLQMIHPAEFIELTFKQKMQEA